MVNTQPEKGEATKGRKAKEDAAFSVTFLNEKNEESARIPANVTGVKVSAADGKSKVIAIKEIPPAVLGQMIAFTIRNKVNAFCKDVPKSNPVQVIERTEEFLKVAKDATLFVPKEGGGPGRAVDVGFWVAVVAKVAELKIKAGVPNVQPMSEAAKAAFAQKLLSMTPEQRKEKQKDWERDKTFRNAIVLVRAERVESKLAEQGIDESEYDVLADL